MKYLFAFNDIQGCQWLQRALKKNGVASEIRTAHEFPDAKQGPELWVRDEDLDRAIQTFKILQNER